MYPTRKITVPNYGWTVEVLEASLYELDELKSFASDEKAFPEKLMSFIKSWDCKDKQGNELPVTVEGLRKLPQSAAWFIIKSVREPFQEDGIKNVSEPSPTSVPVPEAKPQPVPVPTS